MLKIMWEIFSHFIFVFASNPFTATIASWRIDTSSTNITTSAYVELATAASVTDTCSGLMIQNNTSSALHLARGGAGSEVNYFVIPPGGFEGVHPAYIAKSTRLSLKAVSATASTGEIIIQCYQD